MKRLGRFTVLMLIAACISLLSGASAFAHKGHKEKHKEHHGDKPAGWSKGKKTGWHGSDVPPGQKKKAEMMEKKDKKKAEHEEVKDEKEEKENE